MIPFEKWEGLGNDFIVIDRAVLPEELSTEAVQRLCNRHTGVGADGVLLVDRAPARPSMVVRNADGSRPEMCGNGLRCVAGFLSNGKAPRSMTIRTDAGELACEVTSITEDGVRVEAAIGVAQRGERLLVPFADHEHVFETIRIGNPHAVTFDPYEESAMHGLAPVVERAVEGGTNVEFVAVEDERLRVRVWERGVGYTEACGTGAAAVAAAACLTGRGAFDRWQEIALPGGALQLFVAAGTLAVRMRGPARRVFRGTLAAADEP
jgi:diaminopimelate epimerase